MYFKQEYIMKALALDEKEPLHFQFGTDDSATVDLRRLQAGELRDTYKSDDILCTIIIQREPSVKARALFENLGNTLPPGLEQFSQETYMKLFDYGLRTVRILRWVRDGSGHHSPVRYIKSYEWSFDGASWKAMPNPVHIEAFAEISGRRITDKRRQAVIELIEAGANQPLGHELFREAWEQRDDNPRSALVIGIAAAEIGFKHCIGKLVPDAKWLVDNIPSPPLITMLTDYLPKLPVKLIVNGKVPFPSQELIKELKKGITIRNQIVHGKAATLHKRALENILLAVHDLLYLFDVYCGFEWAWDCISEETKRM